MSRTAAFLPAFSVFLLLSAAGAQGQTSPPTVQGPVQYDVSPPMRDMPASTGVYINQHVIVVHPTGSVRGVPSVVHDPVRQTVSGPLVNTTGGLNFDALPNIDGVLPPDTNMAVGPNHILQWVNLSYAVYDKSGNILPGYPKEGNTIWTGFGGACDPTNGASNGGDIIAQYDKANGRWVLSQLADTGGPTYYHCIAVSTSGDPTGTYNRYAYSFGNNLPDYPKMTIWPDGYYASYNLFQGGSTFAGADACAYDGAAMRAGAATPKRICFQTSSAYGSLLPSDLDGATPPPAGSPNFYLNLNADGSGNGSTLSLWKFHVDFSTPSNSTFTGPTNVTVAPFNIACGGGSCIPQEGIIFNTALDSLGDRLMYRLAYRNFGDHEALVVNHSVTSGSVVGVRWYEIRSPNGTPTVFQQGTFDPGDGNFRWMGSAAMDHAGDIAIGYSVSSNNLYPSISYTGRVPGDTLGMLETEASIVVGGSTQFLQNRWGDYSDMVIDPSDDCTFWYTTEYMKSGSTWQTRIASFKFSNCSSTPPPPAPTGLTATAASSTEIDLAWTNPSGSNATANLVLRCTGSSCTPTTQIASLSASTASYKDTTVSASTAYTYLIQASGPGGSANSNTATATTPGPPAAPSNLTATAISQTQINLAWKNNATNAASINVFRCTGSGCTPNLGGAALTTLSSTATSYSDAAVVASTTYVYQVQAVNASGVGNSNTATATTPPPPPLAPTLNSATAVFSTEIDLAWTNQGDPNRTGNVVLRCTGSSCAPTTQIASLSASATTYQDKTVSPSTTYTYLIQATGPGGSTNSNTISATTPAPPPPAAPVLTVGSPTRNSLTLNWTEDTSAAPVTSFDILRCTGSSCTPSTVIASGLAGTARSYRDSRLSRHTTYRYEVRANNSAGSTLSNIASGTTN